MKQNSKLQLKILILWGGYLCGLLLIAVLYRHGGRIDGEDHPILILAMFPFFIGFALAFYVVLWELIAEFKWKLLVIIPLMVFPKIFYLTIYAVILVKLIRDSIGVFRSTN